MGNKTSRKMDMAIKYLGIFFLFIPFARRNKTDNGIISTIPSYLTRQAKAKNANDRYFNLKLFCKNRTRHVSSNKIKSGSVRPDNEFSTILGWNTNNKAPKSDNPFPQNFLHRIKMGMIVITEIVTVTYRCSTM
jgi:hypothetical protein